MFNVSLPGGVEHVEPASHAEMAPAVAEYQLVAAWNTVGSTVFGRMFLGGVQC